MKPVVIIEPIKNLQTNIKRVAAYARVSSDHSDQLNSFLSQIRYYTDYINGHDHWELVDIYADEGITGLRSDIRPEFQRMIQDCRDGKIDHILVKSISRFSRNMKETAKYLEILSGLGVTVYFEEHNLHTGLLNNGLLASVHSMVAEQESIAISNNLRTGLRMKMGRGEFHPGSVPFGYQWREDQQLVIDEVKADAVRFIFGSYLEGVGMHSIVNKLKERAEPFKPRSEWSISAVRYILTNSCYTGDSLWQKTYTTDTLPFQKLVNKGERDVYVKESTHAPIIDHVTYDRVQELLGKRKEQFSKNSSGSAHPFHLKIRCACGSTYRRKKARERIYWVCRTHSIGGDCSMRQIPQKLLETTFVRMYNQLASNSRFILKPMLAHLMSAQKTICNISPQLQYLDQKITDQLDAHLALLKSDVNRESRLHSYQHVDSIVVAIKRLRKEKQLLSRISERQMRIQETKMLLQFIQSYPDELQQFHERSFQIIHELEVQDDTHIVFHLINGLQLTEMLIRDDTR